MSQDICKLLEEQFPLRVCRIIRKYEAEAYACDMLLARDQHPYIHDLAKRYNFSTQWHRHKRKIPEPLNSVLSRRARFETFGLIYFDYLMGGKDYAELKDLYNHEQKDLGFTPASHATFLTQIETIHSDLYLDYASAYEERATVLQGRKHKHVFLSASPLPHDVTFSFIPKMFKRLQADGQLRNDGRPTKVYVNAPSFANKRSDYDLAFLKAWNIDEAYVRWHTWGSETTLPIKLEKGERNITIIEQTNYFAGVAVFITPHGDAIHAAVALAIDEFYNSNTQ